MPKTYGVSYFTTPVSNYMFVNCHMLIIASTFLASQT